MTAFTLAHLSDPHLPMPQARLRELASKRAIGYYNWRRKRHSIHRGEILSEIIKDLHARQPDHIAITGDLVNIALPLEFAQARQWLETVGAPHDVSLVPGNHDSYVRGIHAHFPGAWADYMRGDEVPADSVVAFPYMRKRGPLALIGVSTAEPTAPFMATGHLGATQRDALEKLLLQLHSENLFRVILIHHPLLTAPGRWTARLRDSARLIDVLKRQGAELILHGHDHRHAITWFEGPQRPIPAIGVPSASTAAVGHHQPAAYNVFEIERDSTGWQTRMTTRGFQKETGLRALSDGMSSAIIDLTPGRRLEPGK